jgi:hypothetical protein
MIRSENLSLLGGKKRSFKKSSPSSALPRLKELMHPVIPSPVFAAYWRFAFERQNIFFKRFSHCPSPWTEDPILVQYRFTNAYRVLDRVSQYLIKTVQYNECWSNEDLFFRTILFKVFNRIETWEVLRSKFGEPTWKMFSEEKYAKFLDALMEKGQRIYSAAYIMPSGGSKSGFSRKHRMHLSLISRMMRERAPVKVTQAKTMDEVFKLLKEYSSIGDFLAYQYAIDLNYSELSNFNEENFVVAGPGAREGIEKCFLDRKDKDFEWVIRRVMEIQNDAFSALGLSFKDLWGRSLKLIDCQNLFCEVAKYSRVKHPEYTTPTGRSRIKQKFSSKDTYISYFLPTKWEIQIPLPNQNNVASIRS